MAHPVLSQPGRRPISVGTFSHPRSPNPVGRFPAPAKEKHGGDGHAAPVPGSLTLGLCRRRATASTPGDTGESTRKAAVSGRVLHRPPPRGRRRAAIAPCLPGTLPRLRHLHLSDSKEAKHHRVCYRRFGLRSVCLPGQ